MYKTLIKDPREKENLGCRGAIRIHFTRGIPLIYNISSSPFKKLHSKVPYLGLVTLLSAALGSSTIFSTALTSLSASFLAASRAESFFWLAL